MMRQKLAAWEWVGFGVVCAVGSALHFSYGWSGENAVAAAVSAVNESTWEHMKIFFVPYILFAAAEFFFLGRDCPNLPAAKGAGVTAGLMLIPVVFYTARGIFGATQDWFNISVFFLAAAVSQIVSARLMRTGRLSPLFWQLFAVAWILFLWAVFLLFTYDPPQIPLFADPVTGNFGR